MLKDNLPIDGSVSYIINERNAVVASSDESLSGIYLLNYETIEDSFMSSNNFIERDILDTKAYAGFYNIKQPGWFMDDGRNTVCDRSRHKMGQKQGTDQKSVI